MNFFRSTFYKRFNEHVWEHDYGKKHAWQRALLKTLRLAAAVLRDMREGSFDQRAASLSYTTLLSFAPLLAVTFSVLKGFGVHDVIEPFLRDFLEPLGSSAEEVTGRLVEFVEKIQISVLGVVGVALLLWGVVAMMQKIEHAFNDIWRVRETRGLFLRVRDYLSVLMIGPLSLFLSAGMTGVLRNADVVGQWLHIDLHGAAFETAFSTVPYILFMLAFAALYMFMPNTRVKAGPALAAGLFTGVVWKILGKLFGIFVVGSASYAAIYSAFAAMVLFMIWVYAGWMTVLAGAAVCYFLQNPSNQPMSRGIKNLSLRVKEKIALQVCAEIGHAFYKSGATLNLPEIAARMKLPALAVGDVTEDLVSMGILAVTGPQAAHFVPGRPFDATSVEDMLKAIRAADETGVLQAQKVHASQAVNAVLKLSDKALHKELGKFTLKQLALGSIERMIPRFSRKEMAAIWEPENRFRTWLDIEILACEAQAKLGVIPKDAPAKIRRKAGFDVKRIDVIEKEVKHDVIAFLTSVAEHVGRESRYIHVGMTSSDILDTSFAVQLRQASDIIIADLDRLLKALKKRAQEHKGTICIGRSHGIHAEPTTFGVKLAGHYAAFARAKKRMIAARDEISTCSISGAVGTFATVDPRVEAYVAKKLGLKPETVSTQVIPRDRHAAFFATLGVVASSIENLAVEIRHLQRTEVREAEEFFSPGQKGSSAMPHKRNPVLSENLTGLARVIRSTVIPAMENVALWHERDISHSSVERVIAPDATILTDFALNRLAGIVENLLVYPERMKHNLESMKGLVFSQAVLLALTEAGLSREDAYRVVQGQAMRVWEGKGEFMALLQNDDAVKKTLTPEEVRKIFNYGRYTKHAASIVARAVKN